MSGMILEYESESSKRWIRRCLEVGDEGDEEKGWCGRRVTEEEKMEKPVGS